LEEKMREASEAVRGREGEIREKIINPFPF
jgi:hypothetical protein